PDRAPAGRRDARDLGGRPPCRRSRAAREGRHRDRPVDRDRRPGRRRPRDLASQVDPRARRQRRGLGERVNPVKASDRELSHLGNLESEAIHILREVAAQFERPVLLFSGGKDSIVLLRLAEKAFRPGGFPFPLMHVDTGHNFPEVIAFRDRRAAELGERLIVRSVDDSIKRGTVRLRSETDSRNAAQSVTLLEAISEFGFDAAIGGARRDAEKARAKERVFSFRDEFGQWDPRNQRPELWSLYNARVHP